MRPPVSRSIHKPTRPDRYRPDRDTLDRLAGEALAYLAADPERLNRFFAETGLSPGDLRSASGRPDFAASLIDHLATNEAAFVGFAQEYGYDPAGLDALRRAMLPPDHDA